MNKTGDEANRIKMGVAITLLAALTGWVGNAVSEK